MIRYNPNPDDVFDRKLSTNVISKIETFIPKDH